MTFGEPFQLGRYKLIDKLGAGNYAVVYKAQDELLGRTVALKVLKDEVSENQELVQRFTREARAMANLMHPHIAWVLDMGQAEGKYYLAMRYVEGQSLDQVIAQRGKLTWAEALKITSEIGQALDFAHSKQIIHRDVKPKNIILSPKEGAILTDFGLVKAINDASFLTSTDAIIGTPQYIPPEVWRNEPAVPASDQYALACVFVEMLEGKPLFEGSGLDVIMRKHLRPPESWTTWSSGVPGDVESVIQRALAQDPAQRFPDLKSMVTALTLGGKADQTVIQPRQQTPPGGLVIPTDKLPRPISQPITPVDMHPPTSEQLREPLDDSASTLKFPKEAEQPKEGLLKRLQKVISSGKPVLGLKLKSTGEIFSLEKDGQILIGRGEGCDIVIESLGVSRQHACIHVVDGVAKIEDLASRNGTFIDKKRISKPVKLAGGEKISLGKNELLEVVIMK